MSETSAPVRSGDDRSRETSSVRKMTKGEKTRERILACAVELFAQSGFSVVSLRDIAGQAKITHVGLLHHFASKDELLLEVLRRRDAARLHHAFSDHLPTTVDEARQLFVAMVVTTERNLRSLSSVSLFVKLSAEATDPRHPAHDYFCRRYASLREMLTRAFELSFNSSGREAADAPMAAARFIALLDGMQLQWILNGADEESGAQMVTAVRSFLEERGVDLTEQELEKARKADLEPEEETIY